MKRTLAKTFMTIAVLCSLVITAGAEEAKPSPNPLADIKAALGLSIYLQGGATFNLRNPDPRENDLRVFDHKANSFGIDLAQIVFTKDPAAVGSVGYKLKLSAGETAKWIHSRGLGKADDEFDLTEAYISYMAPIGKGLRLDFGKFVTFTGAEVIEAKDNPNYSRSLLFNYAIPFTHTGFKAGYTFSDAVNAAVYLVNGWDNTDDNNKGKTVGLSVGYTPMEQLAMLFNVLYGPERDNSSDNRFLFDWVGTIKPVKNLSFILNVDYANDKNGAGTKNASWYGFAGIAKYDFNDKYSLSGRAEYFNDKDGVRTGTAQKLKEITITPEIRLAKDLLVRPEYRHDWSDEMSFKGGSRKSQDTLALAVMYTW
jgi:hypothetical protein